MEDKKTEEEIDIEKRYAEAYKRHVWRQDQEYLERQRQGLIPPDYFESGAYDLEKDIEDEMFITRFFEAERKREEKKTRK